MVAIRPLLVILLISACSALEEDDAELVFVHASWRHGDRTPTKTFPTDPMKESDWTLGEGGYGVLTPTGMEQQYELGRVLRRRYIDSGFLSRRYDGKQASIYSFPFSRMLTSATANVIGMYSDEEMTGVSFPDIDSWPRGVQAIPIRSVQINAQVGETQRLKPIVRQTDEFLAFVKTPKMQWLLHTLTLRTNVSNPLDLIEHYFEAATTQSVHHPEQLSKWCTKELLAVLLESRLDFDEFITGNGIDASKLDEDVPFKIRRGNVGWLLEWVNYLAEQSLTGKSPMKYHALSSNDEGISALLNVLGIKKALFKGRPNYSACVIFEFYKTKGGEDKVKALFRRGPGSEFEDVTHFIEGCKEFCDYDVFHAIVKPYFGKLN